MRKEIQPYKRTVHYYETDQMAIVHHSNYIRWFEEARIDYMSQIGISYGEMEKNELLIPVLSVSCNYQKAITYTDSVKIICRLTKFNQVKFSMEYEIRNEEDGSLHATGASSHCFVDKGLKPLSLKKRFPKWYSLFEGQLEE